MEYKEFDRFIHLL